MSGFGDISKMDLKNIERKFEGANNDDLYEDVELDENGEPIEKVESIAPHANVEEVKPAGPKVLPDPVGNHYYMNAEIEEKELRNFLFGTNYRNPMMIFATLLAIAWPIYTLVKEGTSKILVPCLAAALILVYMPFSLYNRAKQAKAKNPSFKEAVYHYLIDEEGIHMLVNGDLAEAKWAQIKKVVYFKSVVVPYVDRSIMILPTKDMGSHTEEITAFIKEHTAKK